MALPGLSFAAGLKVQAHVERAFGLPVTFPDLVPSSFTLVAAFGRCKFRLDIASVSTILQATLGGSAAHFRISFLSDRTFKFFVCSRRVGFYVAGLQSFSCQLYAVTFHLWGNGGPNWRKEFALFQLEEERSWSPAPNSKVLPSKSFANAVLKGATLPVSGANAVPIGRRSVFLRFRPNVQAEQRPGFRVLGGPNSGAHAPGGHGHDGRGDRGHGGPRPGALGQGSPTGKSTLDHTGDMSAAPFCPRCLSQGIAELPAVAQYAVERAGAGVTRR